jgi:Uncharacterised nucleotidyltransferase
VTSNDASERRLIQLLCGTAARRQARRDEIASLVEDADLRQLVKLLKRAGLLVMIGRRLLALGLRDAPELERELESFAGKARKWGTATELASLEVLHQLEGAGIRALPLKGSVLARQLYGDVAARSSIDVDVLVAPDDLSKAVAAVVELGWHWEPDVWRVGGLPALHETLVHPSLPRVELHWRVHWYERRFAANALVRAQQSADGEPPQMEPLDGLIALMLFYARDGFAGLRFPADAAAWWDLRCEGSDSPLSTDAVVDCYPELAAPVRVASNLLAELVGVPVWHSDELPFRWRLAAGLANPFLDGGHQQAEANAGLIDLLLAPPKAAGDAIRRVLHNAPTNTSRPIVTTAASRTSYLAHLARVARRWLIALVPAVIRSYIEARPTRG